MDLDLSTIMGIIDTTGFPIAVCCVLFFIINTTLKNVRDVMIDLKTTVQNNTDVIPSLKKDSHDGV